MFVTDERLRRIGWGSLIVVTALMLTEYNGVSLPPERVLFPDAAFTKTDARIRVIGGCGVVVAVLTAAVRFISCRSRCTVT